MKFILSKAQSVQADKTAIEKFGIPSIVLMENAARSASEVIKEALPRIIDGKYYRRHVMILCGSGNNGGDGFALARHLSEEFSVYVFWIGDESKMSPETKINFDFVNKSEIFCQKIEKESDLKYINWNAECIVESMLGVGGNEYLRGLALPILQRVNPTLGIKIAIDVPAGLNADTGNAHKDCFRADHTITMFAAKKGLYLKEGPDKCGEIHVADLSAPSSIVKDISKIKILEHDDSKKIFKERNRVSSKFNYGRVGIIAGSKDMPGAAAMAANAAISAGAGLVELFSPEIHSSVKAEILTHKIDTKNGNFDEDNVDIILKAVEKCNVVVMGPGIGNDDASINFMKNVYEKLPDQTIKVLDADALRIMDVKQVCKPNTIITPHFVEFSRILSASVQDVLDNPYEMAIEAADKMKCILLLKHVPSIITNGDETYLNIKGNPGMATAGSGDVLTGIIAALAAQKIELLKAAAYGALWHSEAGDFYAQNHGQLSLTATEIINSLKYV